MEDGMQRAVNRIGAAALGLVLLSVASAADVESRAIIVDHNCVDPAAIPDHHVSAAASLRVLLRHASVGQGIVWGLGCLPGEHPTNSPCPCFPAGGDHPSQRALEARPGTRA